MEQKAADQPESSGEYKINVKGPGMDIQRVISEEAARQILLLLLGGGPGTPEALHPPIVPIAEPPAAGAAPSIREYLNQHNAKANDERITAIGSHRRRYLRLNTFKPDDLIRGFEAARERVPKNLPRDIRTTIQRGWIAGKVGEDDTYYVTESGERAVQANFKVEKGHPARRRRRRGARKGQSAKP